MEAAVLYGSGDIRLEQRAIPSPKPEELLLRVQTVAICGSDLSEFDHGPVLTPLSKDHPVTGHRGPIVLGHEFSGIVETSRSDHFREGELVACAAAVSCGACRYCVSGRPSICPRYWAVGLHRDGGLAEYCAVPALSCVSANALTPDAAALTQPMAIAAHAVKRSRIRETEAAVVIGTGGIGSFIVMAAGELGAHTVACDVNPERLRIAAELGADDTIRIDTDGKPLGEIGIHPDVVFEVSGTPSGLSRAISALEPGSRLVVVGIQHADAEVDLRRLTLAEHEIIGTNALDIPADLSKAVAILHDRRHKLDRLAPTVLPLTETAAAFGRGSGPVKTLLGPGIEHERPARMF